jgi:hypothetical protein
MLSLKGGGNPYSANQPNLLYSLSKVFTSAAHEAVRAGADWLYTLFEHPPEQEPGAVLCYNQLASNAVARIIQRHLHHPQQHRPRNPPDHPHHRTPPTETPNRLTHGH